jgi:hypothetical protein
MVRRLFWVALGAGAGVLIVRQASKAVRRYTPASVADRVSSLGGSVGDSLRGIVDDIRDAANERESELYQALGLDAAAADRPAGATDSAATDRRELPDRASRGRQDATPDTP